MREANVDERRNDVFLSFHGSEVLFDGYTLRDLARSLRNDRILQDHWVNTDRIGTLEIFFDDPQHNAQP